MLKNLIWFSIVKTNPLILVVLVALVVISLVALKVLDK